MYRVLLNLVSVNDSSVGLCQSVLVRISSGFTPQAFMISLRASILLTRVLGLIENPDAM